MIQPSLSAVVAAVLLACAGIAHAELPAATSVEAASGDPLESFNRAKYGFNKGVVNYVINPTVGAVAPYTPAPVVTGLGIAFNNLTEVEYVLNGALRRDPNMIATSAGRFVINSTVGIAACSMSLPRLGWSAATTPPRESFTTSPGTRSAAGMVIHASSRRTDAVSASRDLRAARVP